MLEEQEKKKMMMTEAPRMSSRAERAPMDSRSFAIEAARLLQDTKCTDITVLEVRGLSSVCDYIIVASGTSDRQMKTVRRDLEDLGDELGHDAFRADTDADSTWIIVDFVDVVVNLFEPNLRAYYDLEGLWSDAQRISWERPEGERPMPRLVRDSDDNDASE